MTTITVARADVTPEEVIGTLRAGLGPRYHVLPGMRAASPFAAPRPDQPDAIVVGTGSDRLWRAQVTIDRRGAHTHIQVSNAPGLPLVWLIDMLSITRKVRRVLLAAPGLAGPAAGHEAGSAGK